MRQLLGFEYRKLVRCKSIYICLIVMLVLEIAGIVITKATMEFFGGITDAVTNGTDGLSSLFSYSGVIYLLKACNSSNMLIYFSIFVTIFVCMDFGEGTIKNIVSRGFSREQIFFSKSIVICTGSIIFAIASMIVNFIAGSIAFSVGSGFDGTVILALLVQLLAMIAYTMFDVLLSVLFTKLGGALTLGLIVPLVFPVLIKALDMAIVLMAKNSDVRSDFLSRFTISANIGNIAELGAKGSDILLAAVIFVVYILLFTLLGVLVIRKKEV